MSLCIARWCPTEESNTQCFLHGRREAKQNSTTSLIQKANICSSSHPAKRLPSTCPPRTLAAVCPFIEAPGHLSSRGPCPPAELRPPSARPAEITVCLTAVHPHAKDREEVPGAESTSSRTPPCSSAENAALLFLRDTNANALFSCFALAKYNPLSESVLVVLLKQKKLWAQLVSGSVLEWRCGGSGIRFLPPLTRMFFCMATTYCTR
jgi:hypothetical protein